MPPGEELAALAAHGTTLVLHLASRRSTSSRRAWPSTTARTARSRSSHARAGRMSWCSAARSRRSPRSSPTPASCAPRRSSSARRSPAPRPPVRARATSTRRSAIAGPVGRPAESWRRIRHPVLDRAPRVRAPRTHRDHGAHPRGTGEAASSPPCSMPARACGVVSSLAGRVAGRGCPWARCGSVGRRAGGPGRVAPWEAAARRRRCHAPVRRAHPATRPSRAPPLGCRCCGCSDRAGRQGRATTGTGRTRSMRPPRPARTRRRVFLTTGRQGLASFSEVDAAHFLIRCVDPPESADLPPHHDVLLDRGPYTLEGELTLIDRHRLDVVITKDSGGRLTVAKLEAARARRLPVIVVRRPAAGASPRSRPPHAARWVEAQRRRRR